MVTVCRYTTTLLGLVISFQYDNLISQTDNI